MEPVYGPLVRVGEGVLKMMAWRMDATGLGHVPARGPAVVATNHVSFLDPMIVGWALTRMRPRRYPRFLAKRELFGVPVFGRMMRSMAHVPVDRGGQAGESVEVGAARLREGHVVVVFPEGTISTALVPADPRQGAAKLALASGAALIPAALWGGQRVWTKGRPRTLRRRVAMTARFGPPVPYAPDEDAGVVTARLWDAVRELVDASQRAYPDRPAGADDRWWLPRHLGGTAPTLAEARAVRDREARERRARQADAAARRGPGRRFRRRAS